MKTLYVQRIILELKTLSLNVCRSVCFISSKVSSTINIHSVGGFTL